MKRFCQVIAVLAILVVGIGFCRGWFTLTGDRESQDHPIEVKLSVDTDKVTGVVKYRYQLKSLCKSLAILGVREVEVLSGPSGMQRFETWKETVSPYFFGFTDKLSARVMSMASMVT